MPDLAAAGDLEKAWRTLTARERPRAEYYLGFATRRVRDRWPDVDARIATGTLAAANVNDVVVHLVLGIVDGPTNRRTKSWNESAGSMSRSVTLEAGRQHLIEFEDWMVQILEPSKAAKPRGHFPKSRGYAGIARGREEY